MITGWLYGYMALVIAAQVPPPSAGPSPGARLREERRSILDDESRRLEALAKRLENEGQAGAAKEVRAKAERKPHADGATRFVLLPSVVPGPAKGLANVPAKGHNEAWQTELKTLREATANSLFALAGKAATSNPKHFALADECLRGVIARQPDYAEARRLLGYVPYEGGWATPYAAALRKRNEAEHRVLDLVPFPKGRGVGCRPSPLVRHVAEQPARLGVVGLSGDDSPQALIRQGEVLRVGCRGFAGQCEERVSRRLTERLQLGLPGFVMTFGRDIRQSLRRARHHRGQKHKSGGAVGVRLALGLGPNLLCGAGLALVLEPLGKRLKSAGLVVEDRPPLLAQPRPGRRTGRRRRHL